MRKDQVLRFVPNLRKQALFLILIGLFSSGSVCAQINYLFPGMQAQTAPIPVTSGSAWPEAGDTAVVANQAFINDYVNHTNLIDSALIKNMITFRINEDLPRTLSKPFSSTLTYKLYFTGKDGASYDSVSSNLTLTINYDTAKASVYNTSNSLVFYNGYQVKIKVISLSISDTSLLKALEIDNTMVFHNYYKFSCSGSAVSTVNVIDPTPPPGSIPDELTVTWSGVTGVSGYDLEWTYVDSSSILSNRYGTQNSASFYEALYKNNATRVNLTDTFSTYPIPLLFEKGGLVYARIRSFQNVPNGRRMESDWTNFPEFGFGGHQTNLNWQSAISFAEEGKRKAVVQYYDGSLKNRQTVTKDNTTQTTIVAENLYDNQGRTAIQVLPAPTLNTLIQYTPRFNSINNGEYDKTHFDRTFASYVCGGGNSDSMSNNSGASLYYSGNNPDKNNGYNQFIPDAQDYPYSETRYLPDNTGRISSQGGVGKDHQLGSGHETMYFYSTPDQTELDGLFGTEVGYSDHYFKNMVRDANGQYSVSYIDMHGRTIATALDGNLPDSIKLDYLPSKKDSVLTRSITDSTNNIVSGLSTVSSRSIVITRSEDVSFYYTLPAATLVIPDCNDEPVNYDCKYDLVITITDDCDNKKLPGQQAYVLTRTNISSANPVTFSLTLAEGVYSITKQLTINQASLDHYRDSVFLESNRCRTLTTITSNYIDSFKVSHNGCSIPDCSTCLAALGSYEDFKHNLILQNGWDSASVTPAMDSSMRLEYARQVEDCNMLCPNNINHIDEVTSEMLLDVSPGGQYADTNHIDQWSFFRTNGSILQYQSSLYHYLDENGKPDTVYVNGSPYLPNSLGTVDFINHFKPSWANALLPDHPEYSRLQYMTSWVTRSSFDWDNDFSNTKTFREAYAKGYLNPTGQSSFVNEFSSLSLPVNPSPAIRDSFFIKNVSQRNLMEEKMQTYSLTAGVDTLSVWGMASAMGYCPSGTDLPCVSSNKYYPFADTSSCIGNADAAWRSFAGLYSAYKTQLVSDFVGAIPVSEDLNTAFDNGTHTSRFVTSPAVAIGNSYAGINASATTQAGLDSNKAAVNAFLSGQYHSNCAKYASLWWSELASCTTEKLHADSAAILNDLINVCAKGSDSQHPDGSSSISPDSTNTYASFDDVIAHYVDQYNNSHEDPISAQSCNGGLIPYPQAYNATQTFANTLVYSRPDSCQCGRISGLYGQYSGVSGSYGSFSDYLHTTQGIDMPESTLDSLLGLCNGTISCNYLPAPIVIPPSLQCGGGGACLTCSEISALNGEFANQYPDMIPVSDVSTADSAQEAANHFYEQFMNTRTGFRKHAADYLSFLAECAGTSASKYDSLQKILGDFKSGILSDLPVPDSIHFHLSPFFEDNTRVLTGYYPQVFANGVAHISHDLLASTPYSGDGLPMEKDDTLCVNNNFTIEARFKGDSAGFASGYCHNVNFIFWDTYPSIAVSPTFEQPGTPGACGRGLVFYNNGSSTDTVNLSAYTRDLLNWMTLKMNFNNNIVHLYINDTLIATTSYPTPINRITRYALGSNSGYLDYVKVYDSLGTLQYTEQFEDCKQSPSNYPRALSCGQDCHEAFTSFFNERESSSYSFTQIDSIYRADCGYPASFACDSSFSTPPDTTVFCDQALLFNGDTSRRRITIPLENDRLNLDSGNCSFELRIKPRLPASNGSGLLPLLNNRTAGHGPISNGFIFMLDEDGNLLLQLEGCPNWRTTSTPGVDLFDGKSHLVTAVRTADSIAFYIDGSLMPSHLTYCGGDTTIPYQSRNITTAGPYYIGYDSLGQQPFPNTNYNGWISEVRIWNTTRSATEVAANVNTLLSPQSGLAGYYLLKSRDTCQQYIDDISIESGSLKNQGIRGATASPETSDPVWLSGSQISFDSTDPTGIANTCSCYDTSGVSSDDLKDLISKYQSAYVRPATGYVDLDMRTFAGNITPAEGPKGVFDIAGNLIGNTVDSTETAVNASFAAIWNSSAVDQTIGTLTALESGKFRLQLKPGQQAPCNGIVGMRYYQFDAPVDTLDGIRCGFNCYVDFGDGSGIKVTRGNYSDSVTTVYDISSTGYGYFTQYAPGMLTARNFYVLHNYHDSSTKTVTVYQPDVRGVFGFDNYSEASSKYALNLGKLRNLRGYMPQETKLFAFHSTQDSTLNTSENLRNFNEVDSIEYVDFLNGQPSSPLTYFKNNRFGSFIRNKNLKILRLQVSPDDTTARPVKEYLPDLGNNFKNLVTISIDQTVGQCSDDLNFAVPALEGAVLKGYSSSGQIDTILNQIAAGTTRTHGVFQTTTSVTRTSASDAAVATLTDKDWSLTGAGLSVSNSYTPYSWSIDPDSIKLTDAFTDFVNQQLGTTMTWNQVRDLYYRKCGYYPDYCSMGPTLCPDAADSVLPEFPPVVAPPCADTTSYAAQMATNVYTIYSDSLKGSFDSAYIGKCLQAAAKESLTMVDSISEYHYTLYYYDQAGNLVKTIPPAGVQRIYRQSWLDSVRAARISGSSLTPDHTLATNYRYNTLNQVIAQSSPDAGAASFWYDRLGRLVLSQNAKQLAEGGNYSYTLYDPLSRITEVGQINDGTGTVTTSTTKVPANWSTWLGNNSTNRYQVTNTVYDVAGPSGILPWLEQNPSTLRNRVSYSTITPGQQGTDPVYGTYYNYDIEGNVSSLLQDYGATSPMGESGQQYKRIDYDYDLISGKVNSVSYQQGKPDAFMHFYRYDAENRLTDVYTTADSVTVEHEAHYDYYKHGPLARALIGQNQVQGLDYAYTLQGWLKAVNGSTLDSVNDMGHDGDPAVQARQYIGKDAYGFSLHYYDGDYYPISGTAFLTDLKSKLGSSYRGLYNGNISSMAVNIGILNDPKLYNYHYDQLNRLTGMDTWNGTNTGLNLWTNNLTSTDDYKEGVAYDENGNIARYMRNGYGSALAMDSFTYRYNLDTHGRLINNRLDHLRDMINGSSSLNSNYPHDLDNQANGNYGYDEIGNLVSDGQMGITDIDWSVYGKMLEITKSSGNISYQYDASGNRIGKTSGGDDTWYVRDAQGNVLTVYSGTGMTMQERDVYGSSRLGTISDPGALSGTTQYLDHLGTGTLFTFTRGKKLFELTNHLGNVLAVISDKKFGTAVTGVPSQISYYTADVKFAQDYYPFGMEMPGRQYNSTTYTYSFNGKRDDKDALYGWQDYGMREYEKRRAQFISVDPLTKKYPWYSPYQFAGDNPIRYIDLDGAEPTNNPTTPGTNEKEAINTITAIAEGARMNNMVQNLPSSGFFRTSDQDIKGTYSCGVCGGYITDTKGDPNNKFNMKVYNGATLNVDESQAVHFNNYEAFIVNRLTTNFVTGEGAENYNFPVNGIISSKFLTSDIFKNAIAKFNTGKIKIGESYQSSFGAKELARDLARTGNLFSITGFVGSGTITIVPNKYGVQIKIFNITSLTSGDIFKNPVDDTHWPRSYVRNPGRTTPYGNISQTFNLFLSWSSPLLLK